MCVSNHKTFSLLLALMFIVSVCFLNVSSGSSVTPKECGVGVDGDRFVVKGD